MYVLYEIGHKKENGVIVPKTSAQLHLILS